jgi:hypothetical protein
MRKALADLDTQIATSAGRPTSSFSLATFSRD